MNMNNGNIIIMDGRQPTAPEGGRHCCQRIAEGCKLLTMQVKKGFRRFLDDLRDVKTLVIKMTYFLFLAAMVLPWPHFTKHQEALGLTKYQTGIFSTVLSVISIFLPFLGGFFGDKIGNFKVPMSMTTALAGVVVMLFTAIPSAELLPTASTSHNLTINNSLLTTWDDRDEEEMDRVATSTTFWSYLTLRTLYGALTGISFTLYDGAVMAYVQTKGIDYGFQRAWGILAALFCAYVGGLLIHQAGDYSVIFYVAGALHVGTAGLMFFLNMDFKLPAQYLTREILRHVANPEVFIFLGAMLSAGIFSGYLETFMYRYLSSLGASHLLLGLTVTVGAPFGWVLNLVASCLVGLVGHASLLTLGLVALSVKMLGLSVLVDPWWALLLEVLDSLSFELLTTVSVMYCTVLFSNKSITSSRGMITSLNFGLGKLVGTYMGMEIREVLGDRATFRIFGGAALVCAVLYGGSYATLVRRPRPTAHDPPPTPPSDGHEITGIQKSGVDNTAQNQMEDGVL
ncbi:uncharacterized protein [Panulirus ornatus]|uniref:uncharacterized protein n=1 Tax=Panulirus ornatus TaxID=150431 RepID=UPI003A86E87F